MRNRPIRALHLPANHASQMALLVRALRSAGIDASGIVTTDYRMQSSDGLRVISRESDSDRYAIRVAKRAERFVSVSRGVRNADIVHWHSRAALPRELDLRLASRLGKSRIIEFHGTEARTLAASNSFLRDVHHDKSNPYRVRADAVEYQRLMARYADTLIIPIDLVDHIEGGLFRNVLVRPGVVSTGATEVRIPSAQNRMPLVLHAASSTVKGTDAVHRALSALDLTANFRSRIAEGIPRNELESLMAECDVYLDQFILGAPGISAFEAMAMGKPVVAYVSERVEARLPVGCPIISATPETLVEVLEPLLASASLRAQLGEKSRRYVENNHDSILVGKRLAGVYERIQRGQPLAPNMLWPEMRY